MQKHQVRAHRAKKALTSIVRILGLSLPIVLVAKPTLAFLPAVGILAGIAFLPAIIDLLLKVVVGVIGLIMSGISHLAVLVIENVALAGGKDLLNSVEIRDLWELLLSGVNGLFFLALAIFAIMIITGAQNYNLKKALTALIGAVAIANLSYDIVKVIVILGDGLALGISEAFATLNGSGGKDIVRDLITVRFAEIFTWPEEITIFSGGAAVSAIVESLLTATIYLATLAISMYVLIKLALTLIERAIRLALSIVLAPLLFALQVFPGDMASLGKNWWGDVIKWTLVLPYTYLLLGIAAIIMPDTANLNITREIINGMSGEGGQDVTSAWRNIMLIIASISIMSVAANAAGALGIKSVASAGLTKPMDNALRAGGKFIGTYAGGLYRSAADRGRKSAAAGQLLPDKVLGIPMGGINKMAQAGAKASNAIDLGMAKIRRVAKEGNEAPARRAEELLRNSDEEEYSILTNRIEGDAIKRASASGAIASPTLKEFMQLSQSKRDDFIKEARDANPNIDKKLKDADRRTSEKLKGGAELEIAKGKTSQQFYNDGTEARDLLVHDMEGTVPGSANGRLSDADRRKYQKQLNLSQEGLRQLKTAGDNDAQLLLNNLYQNNRGFQATWSARKRSPLYQPYRPGTGEVDPYSIMKYGKLKQEASEFDTSNLMALRSRIDADFASAISGAPTEVLDKVIVNGSQDTRDTLDDYSDLLEASFTGSKEDKTAKSKFLDRFSKISHDKDTNAKLSEIDLTHPTASAEKAGLIENVLISRMQPRDDREKELVKSIAQVRMKNIQLSDTTPAATLSALIQAKRGITPDVRTYGVETLQYKKIQDGIQRLERPMASAIGGSAALQAEVEELKSKDATGATTKFFTTDLVNVTDSVIKEAGKKEGQDDFDPAMLKKQKAIEILSDPTERTEYEGFMDKLSQTVDEKTLRVIFPQAENLSEIKDLATVEQIVTMKFKFLQPTEK